MNIGIENIKTFEKRNKVYTTPLRTIYKFIEKYYFKESDIFPNNFIENIRIMQMKLSIYQLR